MKKLLAILAIVSAALSAHAQFYTGASVGFLIDSEEEFFTARLGGIVAEKGSLTHGLEVEVGFLSDSEFGATLDLVPLFANYRGTVSLNEKLNVYFGGGAGVSFFKVKGWGASERDDAFSAQTFSGIEYQPNPKVSLIAGLRYLWIDEVWGVDVGDDVAAEVGLKFRF